MRARFNPEKAPLLVHCSAGVGRTGTFIVMDTMLERIKEQSSVNVYQTLQDIRLKRSKMVQTQVSTLRMIVQGAKLSVVVISATSDSKIVGRSE